MSANAAKAARPPALYTAATAADPPKLPASVPDCGPDWTIVSSPNLSPDTNVLNGVAAVAANDVWAVGYYDNATVYQTLIQHWDGSAWSVTPSPNVGTDNNYLNGVAAVAADDVWAVGYRGSGTSAAQTLIQHWNGSAWSVVPSPSVGASFNYLGGVAARSATDVWAVGYAVQNGLSQTLILHWDGSAWSIIPSPNVGASHNLLFAVTAVSAADAWAVGYYYTSSSYQTLMLRWDGSTWNVTPSPNVGSNSNYLYGVAAVAPNDVWAVGYYIVGGLGQTLTLHWDGSVWHATASPDPGIDHQLKGVTAVTANDVWAVGTYEDDSSNHGTLILHWAGSAWTATASPNAGSATNYLNGVAAASPQDVWAVGAYNSGGNDQTLVAQYQPCPTTATPTPPTPLATATASPTPTTTQVAATPTAVPTECVPQWAVVSSPSVGTSDNELRAVAAISANDIWAVGYYGDNQVGFQTLTEHWDGSTWTVVPSPNLSSYLNFLQGVTAISANDVWAVGYYRLDDFAKTLIIHWDGSTWSVVPSPNPDEQNNRLLGVTAVSATDVWAVGFLQDYNGTDEIDHSITLHWDGSTWSVSPSPNPSAFTYLYGVTAVSATDVWAVGLYHAINDYALAMHWDGSTWDVVAVPHMGTADNELYAVTAISSANAWAVGKYVVYGGPNPLELTLTEHWDGSAWSVVPSPDGGAESNTLNAAAAISANDVWAVGEDHDTFGTDRTLTEHWDGSIWQVVASPSATGLNWLLGVTAISSADVWAVGLHNSPYQTLTEHYSSPCATPTPIATTTPTSIATPTATATPVATGTPTVCTIEFTDVPIGSPFYSYIHCLACRGIVSGYADGTFRPGNDVTRGQAAKIIANSAGFQDPIPSATQTFNDVAPASTFWVYIERVALHGAISGYDCGGPGEPCPGKYFRPANNLTRGQLAKIDAESFGYMDPIPSGTQTFNDVAPTSTFWVYIERLALHNVISGYQCGGAGEPCPGIYYRPANNITRGQVAKVIANTFFPNCQPSALP